MVIYMWKCRLKRVRGMFKPANLSMRRGHLPSTWPAVRVTITHACPGQCVDFGKRGYRITRTRLPPSYLSRMF